MVLSLCVCSKCFGNKVICIQTIGKEELLSKLDNTILSIKPLGYIAKNNHWVIVF